MPHRGDHRGPAVCAALAGRLAERRLEITALGMGAEATRADGRQGACAGSAAGAGPGDSGGPLAVLTSPQVAAVRLRRVAPLPRTAASSRNRRLVPGFALFS